MLKPDQFRQETVYLFQRVLAATGNVENLACYPGCRRRTGQQVRGNNVIDIGEVPALLPGSEDGRAGPLKHLLDEFCQHSAIGRIGSLARPKDIEVAQAHSLQSIDLPIAAHVIFAGKLLHGIWRNRHGAHGFFAG